jgi:phosphoglycolate phosphatase
MDTSDIFPERHTYHVLVFDLDGTLVDSAPGICASVRIACREFGLVEPEDALVKPMIGLPLAHIGRTLLGAELDDAAFERWCDCYRTAFDEIALPNTTTFPDVAAELARWRAAGRRLAIATSKRTDIAVKVLRRVELLDLFEVVVGGDQVAQGKPNPDMALRVLEQLGVPAATAALVGDTAHDELMAHGADVDVYGVTYGAHDRAALEAAGPKAVVDRFAELAVYLG